METLKYCKVRNVKSPARGTRVAAGIDFFIPTDVSESEYLEKCKITNCTPIYQTNENNCISSIQLKPGESVMIPSGIRMKLPIGYAMAMMNKSGVGAKKQLDRLAELIDQDYEGEIHLNIVNNGTNIQTISAGDKIIQGVIIPVSYCNPEEVDSPEILFANSNSDRGQNGFGSTGTK